MATACEVANYLVYLTSTVCDDLSNMKLNKILYYAQGHYLQITGNVLFPDKIEAWDHGPIVDAVYQQYKTYGDSAILTWNDSILNKISENEQDFLIDIARTYSRYTASALRNMTHMPNSPWDKVYEFGKYHTEIPVSLIKEYFDKNIATIKPVEIDINCDSFIGYRDSNGVLVLPGDWNDEEI